jgi:hypothetical protein
MLGTIVTGIALLAVVAGAIWSIRKDKKQGKNPICGVGCEHCNGACHRAK